MANDDGPKLKELPDGSLVAFFDRDFNMVKENDPKAELAHILKPDGTSIWAVKEKPEDERAAAAEAVQE